MLPYPVQTLWTQSERCLGQEKNEKYLRMMIMKLTKMMRVPPVTWQPGVFGSKFGPTG
jgi:hypothetical protein